MRAPSAQWRLWSGVVLRLSAEVWAIKRIADLSRVRTEDYDWGTVRRVNGTMQPMFGQDSLTEAVVGLGPAKRPLKPNHHTCHWQKNREFTK